VLDGHLKHPIKGWRIEGEVLGVIDFLDGHFGLHIGAEELRKPIDQMK